MICFRLGTQVQLREINKKFTYFQLHYHVEKSIILETNLINIILYFKVASSHLYTQQLITNPKLLSKLVIANPQITIPHHHIQLKPHSPKRKPRKKAPEIADIGAGRPLENCPFYVPENTPNYDKRSRAA